MSAQRPHTRLSKMLHRNGVARLLSSSYASGAWTAATVQTCLPLPFLALYGSRLWDMKVTGRQRVGRFTWRWTLRRRLRASR